MMSLKKGIWRGKTTTQKSRMTGGKLSGGKRTKLSSEEQTLENLYCRVYKLCIRYKVINWLRNKIYLMQTKTAGRMGKSST